MNDSQDRFNGLFSERVKAIQPSFIREILKAAGNPDVISFAGGLPEQSHFPNTQLADEASDLLSNNPDLVLQYGASEGEPALREWIANHYRDQHKLNVPVDNILVTNGSQQGLDLLGKALVNPDDGVVVESPGYLGAIQALSLYQPRFLPVGINEQGVDVSELASALKQQPTLFYCVPNFQNPTGHSYTQETRDQVAATMKGTDCLIVEDDPYGMIRFSGSPTQSFYRDDPDRTIMLGSFSKTVCPGLRVGWVVAPKRVMDKLVIVKQASDLHTSRLSQHLMLRYLSSGGLARQVAEISATYQDRYETMKGELTRYFGKHITHSNPQGGMFMWVGFERSIDTLALASNAASNGVVYVPGAAFYIPSSFVSDGEKSTPLAHRTMRLNFSSSDHGQIAEGVKRLYQSVEEMEGVS